jgi:hypothetical protein
MRVNSIIAPQQQTDWSRALFVDESAFCKDHKTKCCGEEMEITDEKLHIIVPSSQNI